ncbi:hypothetical protein [[Eubacterium] cellulosolvens]
MKNRTKNRKPKCPQCGNEMDPYNAVSPTDYVCLSCFYSTKSTKQNLGFEIQSERYCPEE